MEMTSLRTLHKSMLAINTDIQQFQVQVGAASFDCLFSVRENPFVLALTSRGANPKFFKFLVKNGYQIQAYFDGFYYDLVDVLKSGANTGIKLNPKLFLEQLNNSIPLIAATKNTPSPKQILDLRPDITEQRDRPYFDTWVHWAEKKPTKENLQKTLSLLGNGAYEHSISNRASSKWSAEDLGKNWL